MDTILPEAERFGLNTGGVVARRTGTRVWLYSNFDCNLQCDYCCVRSSPRAPRRALGLKRIRQIAAEAAELPVSEIFITGGEPFLLPDLTEIVDSCAVAAPVTVLTNGMLFSGRRLGVLRAMAGLRVTLQISLDSPTPALHDAHRGAGSWARAMAGIETARAEGFRVRIAASVATDAQEEDFTRFLDETGVAADDRVIRRIARRGAATEGVAICRLELAPEVTITADGVYWHPVGAEDEDMLVTREELPLAGVLATVREAVEKQQCGAVKTFKCA
jgi:MoaA/NifB/PqqE/SkfB family radical SAM enzyme